MFLPLPEREREREGRVVASKEENKIGADLVFAGPLIFP